MFFFATRMNSLISLQKNPKMAEILNFSGHESNVRDVKVTFNGIKSNSEH
jgi:hypothetical protein